MVDFGPLVIMPARLPCSLALIPGIFLVIDDLRTMAKPLQANLSPGSSTALFVKAALVTAGLVGIKRRPAAKGAGR